MSSERTPSCSPLLTIFCCGPCPCPTAAHCRSWRAARGAPAGANTLCYGDLQHFRSQATGAFSTLFDYNADLAGLGFGDLAQQVTTNDSPGISFSGLEKLTISRSRMSATTIPIVPLNFKPAIPPSIYPEIKGSRLVTNSVTTAPKTAYLLPRELPGNR